VQMHVACLLALLKGPTQNLTAFCHSLLSRLCLQSFLSGPKKLSDHAYVCWALSAVPQKQLLCRGPHADQLWRAQLTKAGKGRRRLICHTSPCARALYPREQPHVEAGRLALQL